MTKKELEAKIIELEAKVAQLQSDLLTLAMRPIYAQQPTYPLYQNPATYPTWETPMYKQPPNTMGLSYSSSKPQPEMT